MTKKQKQSLPEAYNFTPINIKVATREKLLKIQYLYKMKLYEAVDEAIDLLMEAKKKEKAKDPWELKGIGKKKR